MIKFLYTAVYSLLVVLTTATCSTDITQLSLPVLDPTEISVQVWVDSITDSRGNAFTLKNNTWIVKSSDIRETYGVDSRSYYRIYGGTLTETQYVNFESDNYSVSIDYKFLFANYCEQYYVCIYNKDKDLVSKMDASAAAFFIPIVNPASVSNNHYFEQLGAIPIIFVDSLLIIDLISNGDTIHTSLMII